MATAVPLYPVAMLPVNAGMPVAMYPPRDQDFVLRTQRSSEKFQQFPAARPTHGSYMYSPMINIIPTAYPNAHQNAQAPMMQHPTLQIRPRSSSASSLSSTGGRWSSASSLSAASPNSSVTSIESMPPCSPGCRRSIGAQPYFQLQSHQWHRPAPIKLNRRKADPGELFAALPGEVLELILQELRQLHVEPGSDSCETCWMRDCCSVSLSARKFLKYAREALYQHVCLVGHDSPQMKKRTKLNYGSRLVLLRRTLRANMHIAVIVRSLKAPSLPPDVGMVEYNDLVASVVMACPNLERLVSFHPTYDHTFQRLFHALSTRKRLKEMNWVVGAAPALSSQQHFAPGELLRQQCQAFLDFHHNWRHLTTLVIHCQLGATLAPYALITQALQCLPSIQNLHLSHLPPTSFSDNTLLALPPLKKLSLSHLPGITTAGLSTFATRKSSASLTSLTLIHVNLETLPALARLFSNLKSLTVFNIVQAYAPIMPTDELVCLFPYLASASLTRLHWDIPYLPTRTTTADNILARSIRASGFPALRTLRAPNDPEGIFQALCRPMDRADHPTDRYRGGQTWHGIGHRQTSSQSQVSQSRPSSSWSHSTHSRSASLAAPTATNNGNSPSNPLFPPDALMMPRDNSDLHQARLAAQTRLERAKRFPRFFIDVIDERGMVVEKYGVGAFMGTVGSKIHYVLTPDIGGTDEGGGLVSVKDMLGDCGEALTPGSAEEKSAKKGSKREKAGEKVESAEAKTREGCIGIWNAAAMEGLDKKDRERWYHTERGRWNSLVPA
ncbi:hypothetical protein B0T16DRAFT_318095 [Cercophora newfieldiana]|uniref:F-box domain-containing protein n=1 Tax=Cercophora newfieldiana TaxID=92897 RepID=A0AA39YPZ4_9PEZI|nr:hypothetical protein B0T16DRAFT_318095 [Cercophora newfieldiana]